jgi:hypothetical protein
LRIKWALFLGFAVFLISGSFSLGDEFTVDRDSVYLEISVNTGEEFHIRLEGQGWYLNRYDRDHLLFRYRVIEQSETSFIILPKRAGISYLLFSYMEHDSYVKVIVDGGGVFGEAPLGEAPEAGEPEKPEGAKPMEQPVETAQLEQKQPEEAKPEVKPEVQPPSPAPETGKKTSDTPVRESEIYYTDDDNRVVSVPVKEEDDSYRRGVRQHEKRLYKEAAESLSGYLEECKTCRYRIDASMRLAEVLIATGRGKEAGIYLDTVIESGLSKYLKVALVRRGDIYYREKKLNEALESYKRCLEMEMEIEADDPNLIRRVGDVYYELNEYAKALVQYERLKQLDTIDDVILFRIATIYDSPGYPRDVEKAYRFYKLLIDRYKDSRYISFSRKRIEFLEKNFFDYK